MIESGRAKYTIFENTRRVPRHRHALLRVKSALLVDEHRLARRHVAHHVETQHVERDAFGRQHPLGALLRVALADHQRTNAVRVAKAEDAVADHHRDDRIAAAAAAIHRVGRGEDVGRRDARRADPLQFGGQHIEQHFGIGAGVQMPAVFPHQHFGEFARIGQIAVVAETDAVGRIDVEGLRIVGAVGAGRRVADMADADVALELEHVLLLKHIAHQAGILAHEQFARLGGHDAGRILTAMLQHRQRVIDPLVDRAHPDHSDDSAHEGPPVYLALTLTPVRRSSLAQGSPRSPTMARSQSPTVSP